MTTDLELVSARVWTDDDLRAAVVAAWGRHGRSEPTLTGAVTQNLLVEVGTEAGLELQVFRPHRRTTLAGPRWVTALAVSSESSEALLTAVLDLLADLARSCEGHVTMAGEVVELDGVPAPDAAVLTAAAPEEGELPGHPPVFASVMLGVATPEEAGWRTLVQALATWVGERRDWLPRWWRPEEEWEDFDPAGPPPPWWPMTSELSTGGGVVGWAVDGAAFPDDRLSQLSAELRVPTDAAAHLLTRWADLEPWRPVHGVVHPWHEREPFLVEGPRRDRSDEEPYLSLSPLGLTEGLPNLYWGNLLGGPWVEAIGADRLATAPVHRAEEVLPGRWVLQLTPRPSDVLADWDGFSALRERVKEHLGAEFFRVDDGYECLAPRRPELPTLGELGLAAAD